MMQIVVLFEKKHGGTAHHSWRKK